MFGNIFFYELSSMHKHFVKRPSIYGSKKNKKGQELIPAFPLTLKKSIDS